MWVTPSPESMTVPVKDLSVTCLEAHDAANERTACTAIYKPGTLNDSNMISENTCQLIITKPNLFQ